MIYDKTKLVDGKIDGQDALTSSWMAGGALYRAFRWLDRSKGVSTWEEALEWILSECRDGAVSTIQFWGHGNRGRASVGQQVMNKILLQDEKIASLVREIGSLMHEDGLWWFRSCLTFGGIEGKEFAKEFSTILNRRVAASTYIVGWWQSGYHSLKPGEDPYWPDTEGMILSEDNHYLGDMKSKRKEPNTVWCISKNLPESW